ncbi:MAG: DUF4124 domain-containing protein [Burkholderiales bacterium]|nr:DUF4124 domain-containing protein [Burkholderiales bacterium]
MNRTTALVATILLALLSLTVGAQVYRWVDKDGKVQYSDQPPPPGAGKSEVTRINSATPSATPAAATPAKAPEKAAAKVVNAEKAKSAADEAKAAKENEEYCNTSKSQLRIYEDGGRVKRMNSAGEQEIMSDEQMAAEADKLRKQIAQNCK